MITLFALVLVTFYFVRTHNGFVKLKNNVKKSFATIDVKLTKRHDLIPNLVEAAKKFMSHEKELLTNITALRSKAMESSGHEKMEAENHLGSMLGQLNVAMENYPDIKSSQNILQLQAALNETEEQISASRNAYNAAVVRLNNQVESFPSSIVAKVFNFKPAEVFEATATQRENVKVGEIFNN